MLSGHHERCFRFRREIVLSAKETPISTLPSPRDLAQALKNRTGIFFSTGEVSGDLAGAGLAEAIRSKRPDIDLQGIGGSRMEKAGVSLLLNSNHLGAVGVSEPLHILPSFFKAFKTILDHVRRHPPRMAVLIGHEVFNVILGRRLRDRGIFTVSYFPPQIWIWKSLARPIARSYDLILTSFQEEDQVYRETGVRTVFVGHYLRDMVDEPSRAKGDAARQSLGLPAEARVVGVFPGSRKQEVEGLAPVLLEGVKRLIGRDPSLKFVLPVADPCLEPTVRRLVRHHGLEQRMVLGRNGHEAMTASDLLLLCSGTATLEAALLNRPMVVLYRVSLSTIRVARAAVRLGLMEPETIALPNLLAGRTIVPELRQEQALASNLAEEAWRLLSNPDRQEIMRRELKSLKEQLGPKGALERAAGEILGLYAPGRRSR